MNPPLTQDHRLAVASVTAGFTLLEMMLVVVLIGILSASIIPEMRGTFGDALLRSTSRDLVGAFGLASSRAVSVGQVHRIRFDLANGRYSLESRARETGRENEFVTVGHLPGTEGDIDHRIAIEIHHSEADPASASPAGPETGAGSDEREPGVVFYPDGTAQAVDVELKDREGFRIGLRINPVTARVRILDLPRQ